jgi:hypothetical protein
LFFVVPLLAQNHEVALQLGGLFPLSRDSDVGLSAGTAFQANYGYRFLNTRHAALFGEIHFLANPQRTVNSTNGAATRDVATIYVTPGIRLKFFPSAGISPYVAAGGGYGAYEQSLTRLNGQPNPAPRMLNRGVFDFGGGVDFKFWRFISLRGEVRDFYTGSPAYNLPRITGGQHNVVAGAAIVIKLPIE